jgi:hypothetical protein
MSFTLTKCALVLVARVMLDDFGYWVEVIDDMAIGPDGRILAVGHADGEDHPSIAIVRLWL